MPKMKKALCAQGRRGQPRQLPRDRLAVDGGSAGASLHISSADILDTIRRWLRLVNTPLVGLWPGFWLQIVNIVT
jgi:hypothetical protein